MNDPQTANLSPIADLYTESLAKHGASAKGVGWGDTESHQIRLEKMAAVLDDTDGPMTINDLGCGYGALYTYLRERGAEIPLYRGYDISAPMLDEARRSIGDNPVELHLSSELDQAADFSFASGIFNVRQQCDEEAWLAHILATLDNMNERSSRGFAFNLLTKYVDWCEPWLFYGDPLFFFDHCRRKYSRRVSLLHDYPLWEWTMLVKK